jgi:SMI1 / KNR4 family (SUKH-1)
MTTIENAYDRFSLKRFPLPDAAQLAELEKRIGVKFPEDYRRFVLEFNGGYFKCPEITPVGEGCPLETLEILFGIGASHEEAELGRPSRTALFDDNDPPKILPIGRTGMAGLIILDTAPGEGQGAIFLKKAFGDFYYLVDGIEAFLALLREPTWA